jgi:hypothetical protein
MKAQTRKGSNTTEVIRKAILIDPRERDIVFETVEEALIPQATLNSIRKTCTK